MNSFDEAHKYDRAFADHNVEARQPNMAFEAERLLKQAKTPFVTLNINNDPEIEARLKPFLAPGQKISEWFAKVGMGRAQVLASTPEEISRFVQQAEANAEECGDPQIYKPRPVPKKFILD